MKKLTLLALSMGMTFGVFAQQSVNAKLNAPEKQINGTITEMSSVKAPAVKGSVNVTLEITNITDDDATFSFTMTGDTTGGAGQIGLFNGTYEDDMASTVISYLLQNSQDVGMYYPFSMTSSFSEAFGNYLDSEQEYSMWIVCYNGAFMQNADGADLGYAYVNFNTTDKVKSQGTGDYNSLVGLIDVASVVTTVYPNPTADVVKISAASKINTIEIVNTLGQVVYSANVNAESVEVNTVSFEKGTYVVRLNTELGNATSKLFVR